MKATKQISHFFIIAACALRLGLIATFAQDVPIPPPTPPLAPLEVPPVLSPINRESENSDDGGSVKGVRHEAIVVFGKDVELKAEDTAGAIIVIGGSARILGKCDECVVIGGDVEISGKVRRSTVAVLGTIRALKGSSLGGDVVGVGGGVEIADGATVLRRPVVVNVSGLHLDWLKKWLVQCVLKMRPLTLQIGWVWAVAGIVFLLYLVIAAIFSRPVQLCVDELDRKPATTFLAGLLMILIFPVLTVLLIMTGIGVLFVPFLIAAWAVGFVVGKVAILEYLGGKIGGSLGARMKPVLALLIGAIIITLLYLVPFVGVLTFGIISLWGLGATTTALGTRFRRERPVKPQAPTTPPGSPATPPSVAPSMANADASSQADATAPGPDPIVPPAHLPAALAFPRASFWERMGAAFLDIVIVSVLGSLAGGPPVGFLVALAYFAGMWAWKGTTVGGVVLKLQVVRIDGGPVTFLVAIVRGIAAAFSTVVLFLGFFWILWDRDKQGWHDKIVGTVVLRMPYSTPLVCI